MTLVAAAVCPHPPLLLPEIAADADAGAELDELRAACADAVGLLRSCRPECLVVVGDGPGTGGIDALVKADFRGFGVDLVVGPPGAISLPLSLAVARWLLGRSDPDGPVWWQSVAGDLSSAAAAALGRTLAQRRERVAMLVMGDGSARRSAAAPGAFHPQAEAFDTRVAAALGAGEWEHLLALKPEKCAELLVAGRASWQVLAGAMSDAPAPLRPRPLVHTAPYGVGYFVASYA